MADLNPWSGYVSQLRVGHKVFGSYRTANDVWEIIAFANGPQVVMNSTPWTRVRNTTTGEEFSIPPRIANQVVSFALTAEELEHAERFRKPPGLPIVPAVDAEAVALLVEKLGAQDIATLDVETGEVWCPNYGHRHPPFHDPKQVTLIEHLRICHGMDISGLEAIEDFDKQHAAVVTAHGREHSGKHQPIGGGFPHRHVPEDLDKL